MKNLVVGAGLTGAIIAERIATVMREEVTVIDKASHVGGLHYDYIDKGTNILVQPKKINILHTNHKFIWDYLSNFAKLDPLTFRPSVYIQGHTASLPLCLNTLHEIFPEDFAKMLENKLIAKFGYNKQITLADMQHNLDEDLKFLSNYFYENVFKPYTMKQWGISENAVPPCADTYYPFYISTDNRYYKEKYQAIPNNGWSDLIKQILSSRKTIKLKLNTDFAKINASKYDRIFYTGSIDEYFDYKYGELPYRSVHTELDYSVKSDCYDSVYNYPYEFDFLRTNFYRHTQPDKIFKTNREIIGYEYFENFELGKNERFYPIINHKSQMIYEKYKKEAKEFDNVFFAGNLGEFNYYETDELVRRALEIVAKLVLNKNRDIEENSNIEAESESETKQSQEQAESTDNE